MSTYADYIALKKRQVIATTFTQNPPPLARRNNTIITTVMANKASVYEKVPYSLTPALGTPFGPAYVTPGVLPRQNNCCIQPIASAITTQAVYTYTPNPTGTTNNTVATLVQDNTNLASPAGYCCLCVDSFNNVFCMNGSTMFKITPSGSLSVFASIQPTNNNAKVLSVDPNNNIYYRDGADVYYINSITANKTLVVSSSQIIAATSMANLLFDGPVVDNSSNAYIIVDLNMYKITPAGVITLFCNGAAVQTARGMFFDKTTSTIYVSSQYTSTLKCIPTTGASAGVVSTPTNIPGDGSFAFNNLTTDITGTIFILYSSVNYNIIARTINNTSGETVIAGSSSGYIDGPASGAKFASPGNGNYGITTGKDGTIYLYDRTNFAIRTIKGPQVVATPQVITYYPKAGALI